MSGTNMRPWAFFLFLNKGGTARGLKLPALCTGFFLCEGRGVFCCHFGTTKTIRNNSSLKNQKGGFYV